MAFFLIKNIFFLLRAIQKSPDDRLYREKHVIE